MLRCDPDTRLHNQSIPPPTLRIHCTSIARKDVPALHYLLHDGRCLTTQNLLSRHPNMWAHGMLLQPERAAFQGGLFQYCSCLEVEGAIIRYLTTKLAHPDTHRICVCVVLVSDSSEQEPATANPWVLHGLRRSSEPLVNIDFATLSGFDLFISAMCSHCPAPL